MSVINTQNHHADRNVQSDKLKLLYLQSHQAVFYSLFIALILAAILWPQVPQTNVVFWLISIAIASVIRLVLFLSYKRKQPDDEAILRWERPYFITLLFSSLVWGAGSALLTLHAPFIDQVVNFFFLIGMAGAALSVYSAIRYFAISTIATILLPVMIVFVIENTRTSLLMSLACGVFLVSALRATKILSNTLHDSFQLTHELTLAKETQERLARTDMLTGLNNRRAFTELANAQIKFCQRHQYPASILLLDLDHFKKVNDTFGHSVGDIVLQHVAQLINGTIRSSDISGRIGGEEFAILLPDTRLEEALNVAEKLRSTIETQAASHADLTIPVTASIGVATGIQNLETLQNLADSAMYQAKQSGRNLVMSN